MSTITFIKQCKCQSTASSPALVFRSGVQGREGPISMTVETYPMACDKCGTPWKEVRAAPTESQEERDDGR